MSLTLYGSLIYGSPTWKTAAIEVMSCAARCEEKNLDFAIKTYSKLSNYNIEELQIEINSIQTQCQYVKCNILPNVESDSLIAATAAIVFAQYNRVFPKFMEIPVEIKKMTGANGKYMGVISTHHSYDEEIYILRSSSNGYLPVVYVRNDRKCERITILQKDGNKEIMEGAKYLMEYVDDINSYEISNERVILPPDWNNDSSPIVKGMFGVYEPLISRDIFINTFEDIHLSRPAAIEEVNTLSTLLTVVGINHTPTEIESMCATAEVERGYARLHVETESMADELQKFLFQPCEGKLISRISKNNKPKRFWEFEEPESEFRFPGALYVWKFKKLRVGEWIRETRQVLLSFENGFEIYANSEETTRFKVLLIQSTRWILNNLKSKMPFES